MIVSFLNNIELFYIMKHFIFSFDKEINKILQVEI
jgi:hypothetical protein